MAARFDHLAWMAKVQGGPEWLSRLPVLVDRAARRWDLDLGEPFQDSYVSFVVAATRGDGSAAVLKIQLPHHESDHEAAALQHWDGNGAVRLLEWHPPDAALLIEHCRPGTPLSTVGPRAALEVLADLLPRLWKPVGPPFEPLELEAQRWARQIPADWEKADRPGTPRLLDAALEAIDDLAPTQGEQVLLHQDLHGDNVLASGRKPWLVIDPKPLAGEREFALAPIVRADEFGRTREEVIGRLDRLSDALRLDRERARRWSLVQTLAWAFSSSKLSRHIETVAWLVEA